MKQISDENLIRYYLISGEDSYFSTLYRCHFRKVYNLCCRILRDYDQAQDQTQDIFVKVCRALPGFEGRSSFSAWLYALANNHCLNARVNVNLPCFPLSDYPYLTNHERWSYQAEESIIFSADLVLQLLPANERNLLRAKYLDERTLVEIANASGLQLSAVKMRLQRARLKARRLYELTQA